MVVEYSERRKGLVWPSTMNQTFEKSNAAYELLE